MDVISFGDVYLRGFGDDDLNDFVLAVRKSVDTVGIWLPWCHASYTETEAKSWFNFTQQGLLERSMFEFGIFDQETHQFLGGAGLNMFNPVHNFCNLGYWVRTSQQRKGIATQVVKGLSEFGFSTLGLNRIEIVVAKGNTASEGVAVKSGAIFECVARNRLVLHDKPVNASVYSLIPN